MPLGTPGIFLFSCMNSQRTAKKEALPKQPLLLVVACLLCYLGCVPERGHSLGARCGWRGPTLPVEGPSPGPGTHLSQLIDRLCPLPYMLHHGRSDPERCEEQRKVNGTASARFSEARLDLTDGSYFIRHNGCHGASNFMVLLCLSIWAQENKEEPDMCQQMI